MHTSSCGTTTQLLGSTGITSDKPLRLGLATTTSIHAAVWCVKAEGSLHKRLVKVLPEILYKQLDQEIPLGP